MNTHSAEDRIEPSAADVRELARLLGLLLKKGLRPSEQNLLLDNAPTDRARQGDERAILVARARLAFAERKRRSHYFNPRLFGEPAWDMLLALYVTDFAGARQSIGRLASWIGEPQSTVQRWIKFLEKEHLISCESPRGRRSDIVDITEAGRVMLDRYFAELSVALSG